MRQPCLLLLNAGVLLTNFVLTWGSAGAQTAVLRTTSRIAHRAPLAPRPAAVAAGACTAGEAVAGDVRAVRLVKFLRRLERLPDLSCSQMEATHGALDFCAAELERSAGGFRALDGARMRARLDALLSRLEEKIRADLAAARIPEPQLGRLVRIVLASTG
ncbi:MAG: hypothetical protein OER88_12300 [Planctomycetota bacterium]|nr:hypothetical protein [Planctomycetota bacterium]